MSPQRHFEGIAVSGGVVTGKVFRLDPRRLSAEPRSIPDEKVAQEIERFMKAVEYSRKRIQKIRKKAEQATDASHANIFDVHLMMLDDPMFYNETIEGIRREKMNAEYMLSQTVEKLATLFGNMKDGYFAERVSDIYDLANQIMSLLRKDVRHPLRDLREPVIVAAYDLGPSDTVVMDGSKVIGFVTNIGGPTSHTAIMAKALEIPAVVGVAGFVEKVATGDTLIVDGTSGKVIIKPTAEEIKKYKIIQQRLREQKQSLCVLCDLEARTLDGYSIELSANIEIPEETKHIKSHGADGIGLFRTEFIYLNRNGMPDEEEQYQIYKDVLGAVRPKPVIFRTFDLGGDKFISGVSFKELNPFLGLRAIRLGLANPEIFKTQMRAILRASMHGNAKMMFPMISCVEEVRQIKKLLREIMDEMDAEGVNYIKDIELGIMVEIPSAAVMADILAKEVNFFSIGTNDLIQYTLAVDRVNERVAHLYQPYNPAILRLIRDTIIAAHKNNIWVGLCGEMAADPMTAVILLGLGIDELSMGPIAIPEVKRVIRSVRLADAKRLTEEILQMGTAAEIKRLVAAYARQIV
ncbi:MAG: Phosphoenolpyruvate-protein phosphotransferase [candidate division BRC1 bacterium ADurb.Bin183]|nr:MAG: Phosphoenolpyruvate-protein phosphotransferase [candidate division BRC1 bacterium ADurb.Bin183]